MIWIFIFLFSCYALFIIALTIGFIKIKAFKPNGNLAQTNFSIIVPFRNEAENLPILLASISALKYNLNLVEFIFVDDDSNDASVEIIHNYFEAYKHVKALKFSVLQNIRQSNSPKKDAITTAISKAKHNWIVTTDADCILPKKWLTTLDNFIVEKKPKMVVAPVNYKVNDTFLEQFQLLDFMSLQGSTIGGFGFHFPFLCNGANLAYQKEEFIKLNGFNGNNAIASGDDIFLFEKFKNTDKKAVQFLKSRDAIVTTFPVTTWKNLIHQRIRWAAKTSNLKSTLVKAIGFLVFLMNLSIILSLFLKFNFGFFLLILVLKISVDVLLFLPTVKFYKHEKSFLKWYLISSILYPFFSVFIVLKSLFTNYNWKGRTFKK
ncbi:glycosyltransferase [uncultured Polaribacter sp.]|uniref:glycosyltransferase family 2 protein n=1 Tax=uncultured Polaribacter sp. TaxID=174711 RepID=UPI0026320657|nr:glycosyltransferase [uncultured Polaribacter sp.]